jgi:hypothetical protein
MTLDTFAPAAPRSARRTSPKSLLLGVLSVTPLASIVVAFSAVAVDVVVAVRSFDTGDPGAGAVGPAVGGAIFFALLVLGAVTSVVALIVLLVDVFSNLAVRPGDRSLWLVLLLLVNVFAFPAYWYAIWWRGGRPADEGQRRPLSAPSSRSIERSS